MMRSKKNLPACRSNPENGTQGISIAARHLHEECGVFGVYAKTRCDVAGLCYYALYALQHRGQESAGIVVNDDGVFHTYRDVGLVNEVFSAERLAALGEGNIAVGHVRYGTTGSDNKRNVQPIVVNHHKGRMALAHNGNLTNSQTLRAELESRGSIFQTTSDTEVISYIIVQERLTHGSIESAVEAAMDRIQGAYSLVLSSPGKLLAVRDPHGFRPLCMGEKADGSVVFASESCALDAVGAKFVRDILPGEIVVVDKTGVKSIKSHCGKADKHLCVFEFIYFARPDSVIDGSSVQTARQRAGAYWHWSIPCRRTSWWACRIPAWTPRWATPGSPGFLTASGLSRTSTSAARSSRRHRLCGRTKCISS
jgi:amidophosphoribosyltransferase